MCCFFAYCNKKLVQILLGVSICLTAIMAIFCIWMAFVLGGSVFMEMFGAKNHVIAANVIVIIMFVLTLALGVLICFCHYNYWQIAVGCFSFLSTCWLLYFYIGGITFLSVYVILKSVMVSICEDNSNESFKDIADTLDGVWDTVEDLMCTDSCPCDSTRTDLPGDGETDPDGVVAFQYCIDDLEEAMNDLGTEDAWGDSDTYTQEERDEYNENNPDEPELPASKNLRMFQLFLIYLGDVEEKYECGGYCTQQDYYLFWDINESPPGEPCYEHLSGPEMMKMFGGPGIVFLLTGLALTFAWCIHYGLCCRKPKDAEDDPYSNTKDYNQDNEPMPYNGNYNNGGYGRKASWADNHF